jgi:hypothetical protein
MILAYDFIKQQASCKQANPKHHQASNKHAISWLVTSKSSKDPMLDLLACCGVCLACRRVFYINKEGFLPAFKDAFFDVFTTENCRKAFEAAGLVPTIAQVVLDRIEVQLRTRQNPSS